MNKFIFLVIILFFAFASIALSQQNESLDQLKQLKGVWKMNINGKSIYESWKITSDHEMSGMSYKIKNNDTVIFEQTKIVDNNNEIAYIATVKNQNQGKAVAFKLVSSANKTFIFENPEHDFPQRVAYQFLSSDSVHAWIDGKYQGKSSKEDYYYAREK